MNRKKRVAVPRIKGTKKEAADTIHLLMRAIPHNEFSHDFIYAEKKCPTCKLLKRATALAKKLDETE